MSILWDVFKGRYNSTHDILNFNERDYFFQFAIGNTPNLWLDVIEILDVVC